MDTKGIMVRNAITVFGLRNECRIMTAVEGVNIQFSYQLKKVKDAGRKLNLKPCIHPYPASARCPETRLAEKFCTKEV